MIMEENNNCKKKEKQELEFSKLLNSVKTFSKTGKIRTFRAMD